MAPQQWATADQKTWLLGWIPDYVRRQAAQTLTLFWPSMFQAWFKEFPEHTALQLPLPSDPGARKLTNEELVLLGAAIKKRKGQLENWFRCQRKKLISTNSVAAPDAAPAVKNLFKFSISKRRRAHQPIEVFQRRNREAIKAQLTLEGYDSLKLEPGNSDVERDVVEEDEVEMRPDRVKDLRAERMRLRIRVVQAMFAAASAEEGEAIRREMEREKETQEADQEVGSTEPKVTSPKEYQDGIDALETVFTHVHKAVYDASGWIGMTIVGGPNPRMNGDPSIKILCHGKNALGHDFEEACLNFDTQVSDPFIAWIESCFTAELCASRAAAPRVDTMPEHPLPARPEQPAASEATSDTAAAPTKSAKTRSRKSKKTPPATVDDNAVDHSASLTVSTEPATPVGLVPGNTRASAEPGVFLDGRASLADLCAPEVPLALTPLNDHTLLSPWIDPIGSALNFDSSSLFDHDIGSPTSQALSVPMLKDTTNQSSAIFSSAPASPDSDSLSLVQQMEQIGSDLMPWSMDTDTTPFVWVPAPLSTASLTPRDSGDAATDSGCLLAPTAPAYTPVMPPFTAR